MNTSPPVVNFVVGETVRAPLPGHSKVKRRAVIADQDGSSCLLLWDDEAPHPQAIEMIADGSKRPRYLSRGFLVAPLIETDDQGEEAECTLPNDQLTPLLEFEQKQDATVKSDASTIDVWKDRGDQLLRLGDAAAAVKFYEVALKLSSTLQIGTTILTKEGGNMKVAEVDCIEEGAIDVTMLETGEEKTIAGEKGIQLCVLEPDEERLQERILLNLCRCFLQLAETTTTISLRPRYLRSAFISCTLAISINSMQQDSPKGATGVSSTLKSALLLRSKAYASLSKYPYAIADMNRLLALDPQNKEAKRRLRDLERQKIEHAKTDKKLVKEMCQWLGQVNDDEESSSVSEAKERTDEAPAFEAEPKPVASPTTIPITPWRLLLTGVALAWILQQIIQ
jgi:tetratricopeptide (TPR) repeat protein